MKTSRVYCSKHQEQTGSFQRQHSLKRDFTCGCTVNSTLILQIMLQTPFCLKYSKKVASEFAAKAMAVTKCVAKDALNPNAMKR